MLLWDTFCGRVLLLWFSLSRGWGRWVWWMWGSSEDSAALLPGCGLPHSLKRSDTHHTGRGSADGELKGHFGCCSVCAMFAALPGSAGECGAEAGLGPSYLEVTSLSLTSPNDPGDLQALVLSTVPLLLLAASESPPAAAGTGWPQLVLGTFLCWCTGGGCMQGREAAAVPCCALPGGMSV